MCGVWCVDATRVADETRAARILTRMAPLVSPESPPQACRSIRTCLAVGIVLPVTGVVGVAVAVARHRRLCEPREPLAIEPGQPWVTVIPRRSGIHKHHVITSHH